MPATCQVTSKPAKTASALPSAHPGHRDAYRSTSAEQNQVPQIGTGEDEKPAAGLTFRAVLTSESPEQIHTSHSSEVLERLRTDPRSVQLEASQPHEMPIRCCCSASHVMRHSRIIAITNVARGMLDKYHRVSQRMTAANHCVQEDSSIEALHQVVL